MLVVRPPQAQPSSDDWTPVFNGRDLTGWDTFLGKPHRTTDVSGLARHPNRTYGTLQFQSEAAEVFFRAIELRPISAIPSAVLR